MPQAIPLSPSNKSRGSAFGDSITGGPGTDLLFGLAGNDLLNGGEGDDGLEGGPGGGSPDWRAGI